MQLLHIEHGFSRGTFALQLHLAMAVVEHIVQAAPDGRPALRDGEAVGCGVGIHAESRLAFGCQLVKWQVGQLRRQKQAVAGLEFLAGDVPQHAVAAGIIFKMHGGLLAVAC